jgi:hypothetical protein
MRRGIKIVSPADSSESHAIGPDYIINVGMWDDTILGADGKPITARVRTTEMLHRSNGQ